SDGSAASPAATRSPASAYSVRAVSAAAICGKDRRRAPGSCSRSLRRRTRAQFGMCGPKPSSRRIAPGTRRGRAPACRSDLPDLPPLGEDPLHVVLRGLCRCGRRQLVLGDLSEHLRDQERVEDLVDGRVGEARIADVGRVLPRDGVEDPVLPLRRVVVGAEALPVVVHGLREGWEVVVLAGLEGGRVVTLEVGDEPLGELLLWLRREVPDRVDTHYVLEAEAP